MTFTRRLEEIRAGFEPAFWVANFTELFERLAYYGSSAVLAIYLSEQLHFSKEVTGWMMGTFGFVVWFLPVLGGTLADRFGFRRALMFAYLVMTAGYFLLGSLSAPWMQGMRQALGDQKLVFCILMIPALGPAVVKPCVAGTTARASAENVRSIGYSIYYTVVNIGGTLGPIVAWLVRKPLGWGVENFFRVSAVSVFLMFLVTWLFFREPLKSGEQSVASVADALKNMFVVLANFRFVLFLLIFSSFYIVFWQEFISAPLFLRGYVDPNANADLVLSVDALAVICFQILVSYLTRNIPTFPAMTLGLVISSLSWLILVFFPATWGLVVALVGLALGEMTQSARYYEYISRLAPPGRQGLYMGYAFLPIAIGYLIAGPLGGYLLHEFGDVLHRPQQMWWVVTAVGIAGAVLMLIYHKISHLIPVYSFEGRINRAEYWGYLVPHLLVYVGLSVFAVVMAERGSTWPVLLFPVYATIILGPTLAVNVQRCHDLGRTGWFVLIGIIPIVGIWYLIEAGFLRGTRGANKYGPDPLESNMA